MYHTPAVSPSPPPPLSLLLISSQNSSIFLSSKPKKIRSLPPHQPPLKFCRLQNLHFPTKAAPISPHPFPRTLRILLFLRSARCWRGELGAPRVFPRGTFFYSTCIYHRDHSCARVVQKLDQNRLHLLQNRVFWTHLLKKWPPSPVPNAV